MKASTLSLKFMTGFFIVLLSCGQASATSTRTSGFLCFDLNGKQYGFYLVDDPAYLTKPVVVFEDALNSFPRMTVGKGLYFTTLNHASKNGTAVIKPLGIEMACKKIYSNRAGYATQGPDEWVSVLEKN